ncbi:MAG: hydrolase, family, partial [Candidatus Paceibacter sp.]|nr:hydrolase, family [Candidatus Paceibacter sp.]
MPHIHEKIDFTVEVFVVHKNKVLLRMHDKAKIWLSVGGHIELNEDPNEAALREVKEEVGLDVNLYDTREFKYENGNEKELIAPIFLKRHPVPIPHSHEHIVMTYFATTDS